MEDLVEKRLKICEQCPLYTNTPLGVICNPKRYINPDGDSSFFRREGYVKGCGCIINKKASNPNNHCVVNKW